MTSSKFVVFFFLICSLVCGMRASRELADVGGPRGVGAHVGFGFGGGVAGGAAGGVGAGAGAGAGVGSVTVGYGGWPDYFSLGGAFIP